MVRRRPTRRSPQRRSPQRRSPKRRSPKRRSPTRRSPTRRSPTRRSVYRSSGPHKVLLLGGSGILGRAIQEEFKDKVFVQTSTYRHGQGMEDVLVYEVEECDVVINCIASRDPKVLDMDYEAEAPKMWDLNVELPNILMRLCADKRLFQISSNYIWEASNQDLKADTPIILEAGEEKNAAIQFFRDRPDRKPFYNFTKKLADNLVRTSSNKSHKVFRVPAMYTTLHPAIDPPPVGDREEWKKGWKSWYSSTVVDAIVHNKESAELRYPVSSSHAARELWKAILDKSEVRAINCTVSTVGMSKTQWIAVGKGSSGEDAVKNFAPQSRTRDRRMTPNDPNLHSKVIKDMFEIHQTWKNIQNHAEFTFLDPKK